MSGGILSFLWTSHAAAAGHPAERTLPTMTHGCEWLMIRYRLETLLTNGRFLEIALFGGEKTTLICHVELANFDSVRMLYVVGDS